ncbi:MAG: stage V sporulation protein G [Planctomycetes bacterium]|nr:stage V sporulation protein G [Planctomycetota bacterium]
MNITEVKIKLNDSKDDKLLAFCSITLDDEFVVRDIKIIDGANGPFVAMPSRKLMDRCSRCMCKNVMQAKFCNECGQRLNEGRAPQDEQGRVRLHADIAHPINARCREAMEARILAGYREELEKSKQEGYVPRSLYDPDDVDMDQARPRRGLAVRTRAPGRDRDPARRRFGNGIPP